MQTGIIHSFMVTHFRGGWEGGEEGNLHYHLVKMKQLFLHNCAPYTGVQKLEHYPSDALWMKRPFIKLDSGETNATLCCR